MILLPRLARIFAVMYIVHKKSITNPFLHQVAIFPALKKFHVKVTFLIG